MNFKEGEKYILEYSDFNGNVGDILIFNDYLSDEFPDENLGYFNLVKSNIPEKELGHYYNTGHMYKGCRWGMAFDLNVCKFKRYKIGITKIL